MVESKRIPFKIFDTCQQTDKLFPRKVVLPYTSVHGGWRALFLVLDLNKYHKLTNLFFWQSKEHFVLLTTREAEHYFSLGLPQPPSSPGSSSSLMTPSQLAAPPSPVVQRCITLFQTPWTPAYRQHHSSLTNLAKPQLSWNTSVCCMHVLSNTHMWTFGNNWRKTHKCIDLP